MTAVWIIATILFFAVIAPLWIIFHYSSRITESKRFSNRDQQTVETLWHNCSRMESRIATLEQILDQDFPDWRKKYEYEVHNNS